MLGDGHPAGGDDHRGERRDVVGAGAVAAGADDVDRVFRRLHPQHARAHRRHRAGDFLDRLAAHPQRHQETADLRRRDIAREHGLEGVESLRAAEFGAGGDFGEKRLESFHSCGPSVRGGRVKGAPDRENCRGSSCRARWRCFRDGTARHAR